MSRRDRILAAASMICALAVFYPSTAHAATKQWTGASTLGYWSAAANWNPPGAPGNGDDLLFVPGALPAADLLTTNDLTNLRLGSITFDGAGGGFLLRGNPVTLTNGITAMHAAGVNTVALALTNGAAQTTRVNIATAALDLTGDINLNGFRLTFSNAGPCNASGVIRGIGTVSKDGGGALTYGGTAANTYSGSTTVSGGPLRLAKASGIVAVPSHLVVGLGQSVSLMSDNQIADTAQVELLLAGLSLNGHVETIGRLHLQRGRVSMGGGTLILNSNVLVTPDPFPTPFPSSFTDGTVALGNVTRNIHFSGIPDNPNVPELEITANITGSGGGGLIIDGAGRLYLEGNNTYTGPTTINQSNTVVVLTDTAFGSTAGEVTLNGGVLYLDNVDVGNKALTVNGPGARLLANLTVPGRSSWSGRVTLNTSVSLGGPGTLSFSNRISGPGGITVTNPFAAVRLAGTNSNDYTGPTVLQRGLLELAKSSGAVAIGGGSLQIGSSELFANEVRELATNQIAGTVPITLYTNGTLNLNNFNDDVGRLTFIGGTVTTGTGTITPGDISSSRGFVRGRLNLAGTRTWNTDRPRGLTVDAIISGSGNLVKSGPDVLDLNGTNTFSGSFTINNGTVNITSNSAALGTAAGGTTVTSNGVLVIESVAIAGEPLTLSHSGLLQVYRTNTWTGNVNFVNATNASINVYSNANIFATNMGSLTHNGTITGTGHLRKTGRGTLVLRGTGNNTYVGDTFLEGIVELNKANGVAIPANGTLHIGVDDPPSDPETDILRTLGPNQIGTAPMAIESSGLLDMNGFDAVVGPLTINGSRINTEGATLFLTDNVTASGDAGIHSTFSSGRLSLGSSQRMFTVFSRLSVTLSIVGSGGISKEGGGSLWMATSNGYSGPTIVARGVVEAIHDFALGSTNSGTIVTNNARLRVAGSRHVGRESLTLSGTLECGTGSNSWAGDIRLSSDSVIMVDQPNDVLNLSGSILGPGNLEIDRNGDGTVIFSGATANSYGDTVVEEGTLQLEKTISNAAIPGDLEIGLGAVVRLVGVGQIANTSRINIRGPSIPGSGGLLQLNGVLDTVGSVEGSGLIDLGSGILQTGNNGTSSTFGGSISGTGNVFKLGGGTWTLAGTNTYTGATTIGQGALIVDGTQPQSPVTVQSAATLGGTGVVGNIVAFGTVTPGGNNIGRLTCSNLVLSFPGELAIDLGGDIFSTTYDQVNVRGTIDLANQASAGLNVVVASGFLPTLNQNFDFILNDGSDAVVDTFAGLPANAVFTRNDLQFRVSYAAGSGGNDVRFTVVSNALRLLTVQNLGGGNRNGTFDPNECDTLSLFPLTNVTTVPVTGVSATLIPRTPGLASTQPFSDYPDIPVGARVNNLSPFQISVLPGFQCGTNVRFDLVVQTASHGQYRFPFAGGLDDSGETGPLMRFDNNASANIPDVGTLNSTISVTGITTAIRQVLVSLHLTHTALEDLDISLISPGGVIVDLTSDNGGTGSDYGTGCADAERTRFEAGAVSLIATGAPPFVGVFAPEGSLAAFNGDVGGDVNGEWTLRVVDDSGGAVGTLRCWSLFIASAFCPAGSGPCESCPERTIYGYLNQGSPTTLRILRTNTEPSTCVINKSCPSSSSINGPYRFDAYTFVNGETNACISVSLQAEDCDLFCAAYRNAFVPTASVCVNCLADMGRSTAFGGSNYSFQVAARSRFVVVVNETATNSGCRYILTVSGGSCRPVLDIEPLANNRVAFDWSTAAIGSALERSNNLAPPSAPVWLPVTGPVITDSRFRVTNTITGSRNFYRLRKP